MFCVYSSCSSVSISETLSLAQHMQTSCLPISQRTKALSWTPNQQNVNTDVKQEPKENKENRNIAFVCLCLTDTRLSKNWGLHLYPPLYIAHQSVDIPRHIGELPQKRRILSLFSLYLGGGAEGEVYGYSPSSSNHTSSSSCSSSSSTSVWDVVDYSNLAVKYVPGIWRKNPQWVVLVKHTYIRHTPKKADESKTESSRQKHNNRKHTNANANAEKIPNSIPGIYSEPVHEVLQTKNCQLLLQRKPLPHTRLYAIWDNECVPLTDAPFLEAGGLDKETHQKHHSSSSSSSSSNHPKKWNDENLFTHYSLFLCYDYATAQAYAEQKKQLDVTSSSLFDADNNKKESSWRLVSHDVLGPFLHGMTCTPKWYAYAYDDKHRLNALDARTTQQQPVCWRLPPQMLDSYVGQVLRETDVFSRTHGFIRIQSEWRIPSFVRECTPPSQKAHTTFPPHNNEIVKSSFEEVGHSHHNVGLDDIPLSVLAAVGRPLQSTSSTTKKMAISWEQTWKGMDWDQYIWMERFHGPSLLSLCWNVSKELSSSSSSSYGRKTLSCERIHFFWCNVMLQLVGAIAVAQDSCGYKHHDLTIQNVFCRHSLPVSDDDRTANHLFCDSLADNTKYNNHNKKNKSNNRRNWNQNEKEDDERHKVKKTQESEYCTLTLQWGCRYFVVPYVPVWHTIGIADHGFASVDYGTKQPGKIRRHSSISSSSSTCNLDRVGRNDLELAAQRKDMGPWSIELDGWEGYDIQTFLCSMSLFGGMLSPFAMDPSSNNGNDEPDHDVLSRPESLFIFNQRHSFMWSTLLDMFQAQSPLHCTRMARPRTQNDISCCTPRDALYILLRSHPSIQQVTREHWRFIHEQDHINKRRKRRSRHQIYEQKKKHSNCPFWEHEEKRWREEEPISELVHVATIT
jgi:hypothetical protein